MPEIESLIATRWSPRAFSDRAPPTEVLAQLFEAARWAPSCYNDQPWYYVVARAGRGPAYADFLATLVPFNQQWAATAPVLMFGIVREAFVHNEQPNRHAWYDLGLATGNLLVQATAIGLLVHQMAGFDAAAAARACRLPAGHSVVAAAALGYPGDPSRLPPEVEEKDPSTRERKALDEFVFENEWSIPLQ